ncbi:uncharacterized protein TM35_000312270 [Trypanosoma theileri]|uniref:Uncharacterized protein n=1 Tax=Trypanosoma theileri TaxID=67003 RepID=A0A1X0NN57_9TRYP|nr:uncharacterized protein TM35_000312270 [Trypanosoma theileri]ORC86041.1 hypothetical protein TM35_000312270 [Trypanosoma theileri]
MVETAASDTDVVSFLHHAGERYKEHRELLRRQQLENEKKTCTFRPRVSDYAENMNQHSTTRRSEAIEKRLYELHAKQQQSIEERRAQSRERLEAELAAELRPPCVTARGRSVRGRDPVDVTRRWLEQREAKFARLREEALRRDLDNMRPTPRISQYAQGPTVAERRQGQRIEDYLLEKEEEKRERMYWLVEQGAGLNSSCSESSFSSGCCDTSEVMQHRRPFTPHITEYAKQLHRPGNVVERLFADNSTSVQVSQDDKCTFVPRVAPGSKKMFQNYYKDPNAPVHERLFRNEIPNSIKEKKRKMIEDAEKEFTGIPRISETSRLIIERKRAEEEREAALQQNSTNRMYSNTKNVLGGADKKAHSHGIKKEGEKDEEVYTFQPCINHTSKKMWERQLQLLQEDGYARTPAEARELLWRRSQKRMEEEKRRRREMAAAKEMAECTFNPKVGRSPERQVERELSVLERNARWMQQRDRRLNRARQELERSQLSECSFHPVVDPVYPLPAQSADVISGYEAHIIRQEESRRRKQEAQEWWRPKISHSNQNTPYKTEGLRHFRTTPQHHRQQKQQSRHHLDQDQESEASVYTSRRQSQRRESSLLSSRRNYSDSSSDTDLTQFLVYQPPTRLSSVSLRSSMSPAEYSDIGAMVQSVKPSPVDFIINHHRAIVESVRQR